MVGGRDFFSASPIAKLNLATQGPRQAGSSFKPFVLAAALTQGIDPLTRISAPSCLTIPMENAEPYRPCNYGGGGGGTVTIAEGTVRSYNTLYVQLMQRVGPKAAMEMATRMGIRTPLRPVLSAVLGSNEVTAMDMAGAYSTFANRGIRVSPVLVTRITRADGTVLFNHEHRQTKVLEAGIVDTVTSILEQVDPAGHGHPGEARPARGGQDGHDRRQQGRVVRGLHQRARHRGVGGVPAGRRRRQGDPDALAQHPLRRHRAARIPPRSGSTS